MNSNSKNSRLMSWEGLYKASVRWHPMGRVVGRTVEICPVEELAEASASQHRLTACIGTGGDSGDSVGISGFSPRSDRVCTFAVSVASRRVIIHLVRGRTSIDDLVRVLRRCPERFCGVASTAPAPHRPCWDGGASWGEQTCTIVAGPTRGWRIIRTGRYMAS
jgi:hypothetical protein